MNEVEKLQYDENKMYFLLYKKLIDENQKLRERIDYPKVELHEYSYSYDERAMYVELILGDGLTRTRQSIKYSVVLDIDKKYKEALLDTILKELGYIYIKNAFDYWKKKNR